MKDVQRPIWQLENERLVKGVQRPKGRGRSSTLDFPSERGGASAPPPSLRFGGADAPPQTQGSARADRQHPSSDRTSAGTANDTATDCDTRLDLAGIDAALPVPEGIQRIIDLIGSDVSEEEAGTPDDAAECTNGTPPSMGEGGAS